MSSSEASGGNPAFEIFVDRAGGDFQRVGVRVGRDALRCGRLLCLS